MKSIFVVGKKRFEEYGRLAGVLCFLLVAEALVIWLKREWLNDLTLALVVLVLWFPVYKARILQRSFSVLVLLNFAAALLVQLWSPSWAEPFLRLAIWFFLLIALAVFSRRSFWRR
jgi:hypothetical protein